MKISDSEIFESNTTKPCSFLQGFSTKGGTRTCLAGRQAHTPGGTFFNTAFKVTLKILYRLLTLDIFLLS